MSVGALFMKSSTVSVIITCYNFERYIGMTIDSVLQQNYDYLKIIVVDDGSIDNSLAILCKYADRITVLKHEDGGNHGQAASLNLALRHVESDYIAFLDGDDLWHPEKIRKQVEILEHNDDVGLVYTNGDVIDEKCKALFPLLGEDHREDNSVGNILLNCYIRTPSQVMVRRVTMQAIGFFTEGIIPDQDMWIRISERYKFYFLNSKLISYRQHPGQVSVTRTKRMWEDGFKVLDNALKRFPYPTEIRRKRLAVIHYRLGEFGLLEKKYRLSVVHFSKSFLYDPLRAIKFLLSNV
jgi:glycosyltransferase involved in cell wall biosynthesis